jgi:hypothetical protein
MCVRLPFLLTSVFAQKLFWAVLKCTAVLLLVPLIQTIYCNYTTEFSAVDFHTSASVLFSGWLDCSITETILLKDMSSIDAFIDTDFVSLAFGEKKR